MSSDGEVVEGTNAHNKTTLSTCSFFGESPKEFWLHMCQACIIATRRFELRPPLVTNNHPSFRTVNVNTGGPTTVLISSLSLIIAFCTDDLLRNSAPDYES